jgi:hypothetical protein
MSGPKERATFSIDRAVKEELDTRIAKSGRSRFVEKLSPRHCDSKLLQISSNFWTASRGLRAAEKTVPTISGANGWSGMDDRSTSWKAGGSDRPRRIRPRKTVQE